MSRLGRIGSIVLLLACRDAGELIEPSHRDQPLPPQFSVVVFGVTDLGSPLGGDFGSAIAVNDLGEVVGTSAPAVGGALDLHAFHWINGAVRDLEPHLDRSQARDVNAAGHVVGILSALFGFDQAIFWGTGPRVPLALVAVGTLEELQGQSAEAINNHGEIVGVATVATEFGTVLRGLYWADKTAVAPFVLGTLAAGDTRALDINNKGQIVGSSRDLSGPRPVFWASKDAPPVVLLPLPGNPDGVGSARAINELGQIVGSIVVDNHDRAVVWPSKDAVPIDLGSEPGHNVSHALDINELGEIVGAAGGDAANRAVLWLPDPTQPLSYLLYPLGDAGGTRSAALGLNNVGQAVGESEADAVSDAVLWSIPILAPIQVTGSPIKLDGKGLVQVAILSNPWFNATNVDPASLTLGNDDGLDTPIARKKKTTPMSTIVDLDRDGDPDLVAEFEEKTLMSTGDLTAASTSLTLLGRLRNGKHIRGVAAVGVQ